MGLLDLFRRKSEVVNQPIQQEPQNFTETFDEYGNSIGEFFIEDVFTISGRGTVVTGRVTRGTFKVGETVKIPQVGITTTITGIEMFRKTCAHAIAGDNVGILLSNVDRNKIQRGYTIVK